MSASGSRRHGEPQTNNNLDSGVYSHGQNGIQNHPGNIVPAF